jgi:hypothetical protein
VCVVVSERVRSDTRQMRNGVALRSSFRSVVCRNGLVAGASDLSCVGQTRGGVALRSVRRYVVVYRDRQL